MKAQVILGLTYAKKNHPAIGFVRANLVFENSSSEILKLRNRITELETQIESISNKAPAGSEKLSQGDDLFEMQFSYKITFEKKLLIDDDYITNVYSSSTAASQLSWNTIFSSIAPIMVNEATEYALKEQINRLLYNVNYDYLLEIKEEAENEYSGKEISDFEISDTDFQTIKIQLKSLGLITQSTKTRSVKNRATYWTLTPYGDNVMTRLIAIKRE